MKKQILEEIKEMRYLFNYDRGKIISEQNQNLNEMIDLEKGSFGYDLEEDAFGTYENELEEEIDFEVPTMEPGTKEKERTTTKPGTKPDEDSPYKPKPGTKKKPKARKGDMPDWLSFDELGINLKRK